MADRTGLLGLLLLLLLAFPARGADLARSQTVAVEAGQAYEAGDYEQAVSLYRMALEDGLDHAILHYNLGNAYYKAGELGHAIACYERALRRNPRDAAIRSNLERARSQIRDEGLAPLALPLFLKPLVWLYAILALNEWATLLLIAAALLAFLLILGQWGKGPAEIRHRLLLGASAVAVVAALMTALHYRAEQMRTVAVVVAEEVMVRSGPGNDYNLSFKIHEGLRVYVAELRDDWCRIHLGGELVGWVPRERLEIL